MRSSRTGEVPGPLLCSSHASERDFPAPLQRYRADSHGSTSHFKYRKSTLLISTATCFCQPRGPKRQQMDTGLFITDMIGFGVNQITGDYSRGASGFWVENGELQYPVEEITVAGNLTEMYKQIVHIGNDVDPRGNVLTGSVLIENMTVAGE